jgi:hypothetical protein
MADLLKWLRRHRDEDEPDVNQVAFGIVASATEESTDEDDEYTSSEENDAK